MATNNHELLGQALGTCTLRRLIGRGGMGAVYLAQQSRPRRTVAVKVLMPGTFLDQRPRAEFLLRFRREADAVAALDHVNIMPIYEYGEQGDLAYLVMPYVTGGTLRQLLEKRGTLSLEETCKIIDQAAAALDTAHAQGIIHRDLKPGNILFHADGRVLLADFGLAKMVKEAQEFESSSQTALTSAGTIIGTPEYLSPEQGTGKLVDYRTDVYSLGIVLFQMLGGHVPFAGASPVAIAIKHALEQPPSLTELNPAIPASVEAVVRKAIEKNPDDRYNSAGELAQALREAAGLANEYDFRQPTFGMYNTAIESPGAVRLKDDRGRGELIPAPIHRATTAENTPVPAFNTAPTEEVPPIPTVKAPESAAAGAFDDGATQVETSHKATDASSDDQQAKRKTHEQLSAKEEPVLQPVRLSQQQTLKPDHVLDPYQKGVGGKRKGGQPFLMMMLGSLLTLMIVVGGVVAYLNFGRAPVQTPKSIAHITSTAVARGNQPRTQKAPGTLPPAQITAGPLLYGTALPGPRCDTQGGRWVSTPGARITCDALATDLNNSGSSQTAGLFLEAMKGGKTLTNDYIVQAQVIIRPDSHANFGLFFLTQQGQTPATYSWMINPAANTCQSNYYTKATDLSNTIVRPIPINGVIGNTITIDMVAQGNGTVLYVNGQRAGGTSGLGNNSGTFGLAAEAGANVAFKNVAVYALP